MPGPAPAAPPPPLALESAFVLALALAPKAPEDPIAVLAGNATARKKLAAVEKLHRSLPKATAARKVRIIAALRRAASSPAQAPEVRAAALTHLGYAVPELADAGERKSSVHTLLAALAASADRIHALRGLTSAAHALPDAVEGEFQATLLGLLAGPLSEEERVTALLALDAFLRGAEDLPVRRPALLAEIDTRLLAPITASPAAFAAGATARERILTLAVVWHAARRSSAAGDATALDRINAILRALQGLESDPAVRAEIAAFLAAPAPSLQSRP